MNFAESLVTCIDAAVKNGLRIVRVIAGLLKRAKLVANDAPKAGLHIKQFHQDPSLIKLLAGEEQEQGTGGTGE